MQGRMKTTFKGQIIDSEICLCGPVDFQSNNCNKKGEITSDAFKWKRKDEKEWKGKEKYS